MVSKSTISELKYNTLGFLFQNLLSDPNVWKVGVGIDVDAELLRTTVSDTPDTQSFLDLRYIVDRIILDKNGRPWFKGGLKAMARVLLRLQIPHINPEDRPGNWDDDNLTTEQKEYAAGDAIAGMHVFKYLLKRWLKNVSRSNFALTQFESVAQ